MSSVVSRLLPLAMLVAVGCIRINTKGYPTVERTDVAALVTTTRDSAGTAASDTVWTLSRPPFTVVGRTRATMELPTGLTGVVRGWERMFGAVPGPATVVLVEMPTRGGRSKAPITLPDSLARRTTVWVLTAAYDEDRQARMPMGPGNGPGPAMVGGSGTFMGGGPGVRLAQEWLDAYVQRTGGSPLPPWLRSGLVEAIGGLDVPRMAPRRGRDDVPRLALDTLLARRCPDGWAPIRPWRPGAAPAGGAPAGDTLVRAPDRVDRQRMFEETMRDPCGPTLRLNAASFVRFLLERGGDDRLAEALVKTYQGGGRLEEAIRGRQALPATVAELDRAWRAWEEERALQRMRSPVGE
jgi:hypothetical protein